MADRKSFRLNGVVRAASGWQQLFQQVATSPHRDLVQIHSGIQRDAQLIKSALQKAGIQVGNLPTRSMRAAAWLLFLAQDNHLEQHLKALGLIIPRLPTVKDRSLSASFDYSSYLYRVSSQRKRQIYTFHEAFIYAPDHILQQLADLSLSRGRVRRAEIIRAHTKSERFRQIKSALEQFSRAVYLETDARGQQVHLRAVFDQINLAHFGGRQTLPHLCWSSAPTRRKLGHFNPVSDSIQVSSLLDRGDLPPYALGFIVYHELLHRALMAETDHPSTRAHSSRFRQAEQQFPFYQQAQELLQELHHSGRK